MRTSSKLALVATLLLVAPAAQACQLVCTVIPYVPSLIAGGDTAANRNAKCSAARAGFKPADPGMLGSLPNAGYEYYRAYNGGSGYYFGPVNGMKCDDPYRANWQLQESSGSTTGVFQSAAASNCTALQAYYNPSPAPADAGWTLVCCNM